MSSTCTRREPRYEGLEATLAVTPAERHEQGTGRSDGSLQGIDDALSATVHWTDGELAR